MAIEPPPRGPARYAVYAALLSAAALAFFVAIMVTDSQTANALWSRIFGRPMHQTPVVLAAFVGFVVTALPELILFGLSYYYAKRYFWPTDRSAGEALIRQLAEARAVLERAQGAIAELEVDYAHKLHVLTKTTSELESVRSLKSADLADLRKKISAIDSARGQTIWLERVVGFIAGIVASLIANAIWVWAYAP